MIRAMLGLFRTLGRSSLILIAALAGCVGVTVIARHEASPSDSLVAIAEAYGSPGRAFSEMGEKRVSIFVLDKRRNAPEDLVMRFESMIRAANLHFLITWDSDERLRVELIDVAGQEVILDPARLRAQAASARVQMVEFARALDGRFAQVR